MQFFQLDVSIEPKAVSPFDKESVDIDDYISIKLIHFNEVNKGKAQCFLADTSYKTISFGIVCPNVDGSEKLVEPFLGSLGLEYETLNLEEITLTTFVSLLSLAMRNEYITDYDEVLGRLNIDNLYRVFPGSRGISLLFEDEILPVSGKAALYKMASSNYVRNTLVPELDRIYTKSKKKVLGHPVHYMIESDEIETATDMCRTILSALYANGRLRSKRYQLLPTSALYMAEEIIHAAYKCAIGGTVVIKCASPDEDEEDDYASCSRAFAERLGKICRKYRNDVLTIILLPSECEQLKAYFREYISDLGLVEIQEDYLKDEDAKGYFKTLARNKGVRANAKLFSQIEEGESYKPTVLREIFDQWYNAKLKTDYYPQYLSVVSSEKNRVVEPKGNAYNELMEMVGITEAKKVISQALDFYKAQKLFRSMGMNEDRPAMHMIFTGNPGTAKTTVARLFTRILKDNNILSVGQLVEVGRSDLVGKYVGWTAPNIKKKFNEARGGVLFIDEAYSLVDDRDGSFGDEAINTIVQEMENHRDSVVVIFAGYPDKMESFMAKNPGLRSRIAFHVKFDDYNSRELCDITTLIAKKQGLKITEGAITKLEGIYDQARQQEDFGNGRYARNIVEKARLAQASRLIRQDLNQIDRKAIATLCEEDIEMPETLKKESRQIGFSVL